jgi:DNA recombination protein RmuC
MNEQQIIPIAFFITLAIGLVIASGIALFALRMLKRLYMKLKAYEVDAASNSSMITSLRLQSEELDALRREHMRLLEERSAAVTERAEAMRQIDILYEERRIARQEREDALDRAAEAEKMLELAEQRMRELQRRMDDWENHRREFIKLSEAAVLEAGSKMSSKLLEDHKREAEAVKKQQEEQVRSTTEKLLEQFTDVTKAVHSLKDISSDNSSRMETVMRALSNPAGAGKMAEIGLENSLKNLGLEVGRDFVMQYHIAGDVARGGLRPDAVIFLPQDMVMVIDSKASKFILELAQAQNEQEESDVLEKLRRSMNEHLRALTARDYKAAILQQYKEAGRSGTIGHVFNVMYLPSESAIEKIRSADPQFDEKVEKADIILAGPASLTGLFSLAKMNIAAARQAENEEKIISTVKDLMESIAIAFSHVDRVGTNIKSTVEHFERFARSVNSRVLPKMQRIQQLGVQPAHNREVPKPFATYDIRRIEETVTIEADAPNELQRNEALSLAVHHEAV